MTHDLGEALRHAQLVLAYAAHQGIALPPDAIRVIPETRVGFEQQTLSAEGEAQFWKAFTAITILARPATVSSLIASEPSEGKTRWFSRWFGRPVSLSLADRAARRYRSWALVWLVVLVITQMYWLIGSTAMSDIQTLPIELEKTTDAMTKRRMTVTDASNQHGEVADDAEVAKLETRRDRIMLQIATSYEVLAAWNRVWNVKHWGHHHKSSSLVEECAIEEGHAIGDGAVQGVATDGSRANRQEEMAKRKEQSQHDAYVGEAQAQFALKALQLFVLPAFYGLLGTCAFILRSLVNEIRAVSYASDVGYRLRMPMGALAGVAIAWFLPESVTGTLKSVSPFALAFLAGYSVELLFTAMDRLIATFSSAEVARAPAAR